MVGYWTKQGFLEGRWDISDLGFKDNGESDGKENET